MQGVMRRVVYVALYEGIAVVCASMGLALMSGQGVDQSGPLALVASGIAIVWTLVFNALFERWESRQAVRGRSVWRRIVHAAGFEIGMVTMLVPVIAWWLGTSLWEALLMDLGLVVFFLAYTFVFNWAFDRTFGLPASAATPA